jgi:ATP-dependent DNA helicase RecG
VFTRIDVEGGDVLTQPLDLSGLSLLEQLSVVEERIGALNASVTVKGKFAEGQVQQLPQRAIREAILNAIIHRDWMINGPVLVTLVDADHVLEVVSPGGFTGGVNTSNVLTQRYSRHPALADVFRALRLVDKQGLGVDRMYREMIVLGHRPPSIDEQAGLRVRVRLAGGAPVVPVMDVVLAITPEARQRDVRIAILLYELLHHPFLTVEQASSALQRSAEEAGDALESAAACLVAGVPLIYRRKDVWLLSKPAIAQALGTDSGRQASLHQRGVLTYRRPSFEMAAEVVRTWLQTHDQISTGDYAAITGISVQGAQGVLGRLVTSGDLQRGETAGRKAHYILGTREDGTQ